MLLNISEVLSEPHRPVDETVTVTLENVRINRTKYQITEFSPVHLRVEHESEKKFVITGQAKLTAVIPCDRCLEDVPTEIELDFEKHVNLAEDAVEDDLSDEANYIDGFHLDVEQLLYNEILIGWPMKVLCRDDCKGLCSVCGRNLNFGTCDCEDTSLDPRMSVIRDLYKNFKEV